MGFSSEWVEANLIIRILLKACKLVQILFRKEFTRYCSWVVSSFTAAIVIRIRRVDARACCFAIANNGKLLGS